MAEPPPQPTEPANDLIADEQDAMAATDRLHPRPIARRWNDHSARTLNRFADERRDILRTDCKDSLLDGTRGTLGKPLRVFAEPFAERVGLHDVLDARN